MKIIYVRLLDEGTTVYRPVPATFIKNETYRLGLPKDHYSTDENWEFPTGGIVRVEKKILNGIEELVAVSLD